MHLRYAVRALPVVLFVSASSAVFGQIVSGTIVGAATDKTGGVVTGVHIQIVNQGTGLSRTVQTDQSGNFVVPQLPPGEYGLNASAAGFQDYEVNNIILQVDQTVRVDLKLQLSTVSSKVVVSATAAQVESETSSLASISTANTLLTSISSGGTPGRCQTGFSHCGPLAYQVLKGLNEAAANAR